jgi:hypothetical protein
VTERNSNSELNTQAMTPAKREVQSPVVAIIHPELRGYGPVRKRAAGGLVTLPPEVLTPISTGVN